MPVPRTQLGGLMGGGSVPVPAPTIDLGNALQGLLSGASSLLQNAYLRKVAQQNRQAAEQQRVFQQQQAEATAADRQAHLGVEQQRLQIERDKANAPKPARTHYDAQRGVIVDEDTGTAKPVEGLPPAPTKEGAAHYDAARGVFVHPDGTVTKVEGLPAPQPRARASSGASGRASGRAGAGAAVTASKGALDEALREVPRPSRALGRAETPSDAEAVDPKTGQPANPAYQRLRADSVAYEQSTLQPARLRYRQAVDAVAGPPQAAPGPRLRTQGRENPAMQAAFADAAARYQRALQVPGVTREEARTAYEATVAGIARRYRGQEAVP